MQQDDIKTDIQADIKTKFEIGDFVKLNSKERIKRPHLENDIGIVYHIIKHSFNHERIVYKVYWQISQKKSGFYGKRLILAIRRRKAK